MKCSDGDIKHLTTVGMIVINFLHSTHYIRPYIYMFNETLLWLLHRDYCTINCLEIFVIIDDR